MGLFGPTREEQAQIEREIAEQKMRVYGQASAGRLDTSSPAMPEWERRVLQMEQRHMQQLNSMAQVTSAHTTHIVEMQVSLTEMREFITFAAGHSPTTFQAFADYKEVLAKMTKAMPKVETEHTMAQTGVAVVHVGNGMAGGGGQGGGQGGIAMRKMTASEIASLQAQANAWRK